MVDAKADIEADMESPVDRGEAVAAMEPLQIGETSPRREGLNELAFMLAQRSAGFKRALPPTLVASLADLVRSMNCYYSNLIEGHDTHPIDIERALRNDYSADAKKRNLQLEAKAHIEVQQWIDGGGIAGRATDAAVIPDIHRRFCAHLPDELLWVSDPESKERIRMIPGALRRRDVKVGQHVAVSPGAVPRFLDRYAAVYGGLGPSGSVIAAAAAHHRLLWIHPFLDGNGRVARLISHATLLRALDTGGLWSVARGLARNVATYKGHLAACDLPRRNDLDGRGALSEENLLAFTKFFLETCLDQIGFMETLMQPEALKTRILLWAEEEMRLERLPKKAGAILEAVLYRGELSRADVATVVETGDRQARRLIAPLLDAGVLVSESSRAPLRLAFPASLASRWMPGLFPDYVER